MQSFVKKTFRINHLSFNNEVTNIKKLSIKSAICL